MIARLENQDLQADISIGENGVEVRFEDPSYVRSDMLILHGSNNSLGVILHEGYHHICALPQTVSIDAVKAFQKATLLSVLPDGSEFRLSAPLRCVERK